MPKQQQQQQQIVLAGASLLPKQRKYMIRLGTDASLRGENNDNKSYFLALGHHFEAKTRATSRTS